MDVVSAFRSNGDDAFPLTHSDVEVSSMISFVGRLKNLRPEIVINTAAMHHVENCEKEPEKAFAVNALGPEISPWRPGKWGILMHVSTDYVFDGGKGPSYVE